jgi:neopullulanase
MRGPERMQRSTNARAASAARIENVWALSLHNAVTVISTIRMELILMQNKFRWILTLFFLLLLALRIDVYAQSAEPVINRIDPPNWWPTLPDPMLLVYGFNLNETQFGVTGRGVRIVRTQSSANGHYAFLWLATKNAEAQKIEITASNAAGSAKRKFALVARRPAQKRYQGLNPSDVVYLIMTDRFVDGDPSNDQPGSARDAPRGWHGGDFAGIRQHLDYLQELGVTALWTTPILSNGDMPESYHGYAAVDLYAIDSHFGSLDEYRRLADDLHARGMKIVYDIVPNHIGVQHPWVQDPPAPDWLHGSLEHHVQVQSGFESLVDSHAPSADRLDITHGWFTDGMPDLNQENELVATYLIQNAIWWIETAGLDGLRIDTFPYVSRAFWSKYHRAIHDIYPKLTTVGEVFNPDATITSYFAGGASHDGIDTGLDTPFDFPLYFALRDVLLRKKPMTELRSVLAQDHLYPHPERLVTFFGNHDTVRFMSEQNSNLAELKLAFALLATLRGVPEIYSGDEIAMEGKEDPDNRRDFPGGFPADSQTALATGGRTGAEKEVFEWTSALFRLRQTQLAITAGGQQNLFADSNSFAFLRGANLDSGCRVGNDGERILVLANDSNTPKPLELKLAKTGLENCSVFTPLLPLSAPVIKIEGGRLDTILESGAAIYAVK